MSEDFIAFSIISIFVALLFGFMIPRYMKKLRIQLEQDIRKVFPDGGCELVADASPFLAFMGRTTPRVTQDGLPLDIVFTQNRKGSNCLVNFYLPLRHRLSLHVSREGMGEILAKQFGLSKDFTIGEPELDSALVFGSSDEGAARSFLAHPEALSLIKSCLKDIRFEQIIFTPETSKFRVKEHKGKTMNPALVYPDRDYGTPMDWPGILISRAGSEKIWADEPEKVREYCDTVFRLAKLCNRI